MQFRASRTPRTLKGPICISPAFVLSLHSNSVKGPLRGPFLVLQKGIYGLGDSFYGLGDRKNCRPKRGSGRPTCDFRRRNSPASVGRPLNFHKLFIAGGRPDSTYICISRNVSCICAGGRHWRQRDRRAEDTAKPQWRRGDGKMEVHWKQDEEL